jgi:hypothetical protein
MKKQLTFISISLCLLINSVVTAQVTSPTNNTILPPQYVGWSGLTATVKPLDLKNGFNNQPINFFTNNSGTNGVGNAVQRMTISGTTGFVGVGNNFTTPLNLVDVRDGNINIGQGIAGNVAASPQSYMIGGQNILWHKGNPRNIFAGVGS